MTTSLAPALGGAESGLRTGATHAPLGRLLRSELRWIFRRPRTLIALGLLALVPIAVAVGVAVSGSPSTAGGPGGLFAQLVGNGLALPVIALALTMQLLLPLVGSMSAADAIAGESAHGTLRGLLIAPVGRIRLFWVKASGVLAVVFAAVLVIAVVGLIAGLVLLGSDNLLTISGTHIGVGAALGRVGLAVLWVTVQMFAVAAVALAISACTQHPLVVMAATLAGVVVCAVLQSISVLDWLAPYLLTDSWMSVIDLLRDPVPASTLWEGLARAACYLVIGLSLALARMVTRDG
jgi:ABC-2 type transport system permease protein